MNFRLTATKALRDLTAQRGRAALLVAANALGLLAFVALVSGYRLLDREIERSFGGSVPASAVVNVEAAGDAELAALLSLARRQPGVLAAELRRTETATAERSPRTPGAAPERVGLQLFIVESFAEPQVSTFTLEEGRAPGLGEIAVEQSALGFLRSGTGSAVVTSLRGGAPKALTVSGVVHDPGQAPAWMEGTGYGYVTRETLGLLLPPNASALPDDLLIAFERGPSFTREGIAAGVDALRSAWDAHRGEVPDERAATELGRAFIPPPGEHPHQGQMEALLLTLLVFAGFAFVLAAVLDVTTLQALLHTQIPQIGTLKTLGASRRRIAALYALTLGVLGALGAAVGVPLGLLLGRAYAELAGGLLNLRMDSTVLEPRWLFLLVLTALLLPVALALPAVLRTTGRTVRECLAAVAPSHEPGLATFLPTFLPGRSGRPLITYALRNALRRPGRMALSLATLIAANVVLFTAANVGRAWLELLDEADRRQPHSATLRLAPQPDGLERAEEALSRAAFDAEVWRSYVARSDVRPGESFSVRELREPTSMIDLEVLVGRWLLPDDADGAVVLDHALAQKLGASVGDEVTLLATAFGGSERDEASATLTVVGIAEEIGSLGGAYVRKAPVAWQPRSLRVVLAGASQPTRSAQQELADAATDRLTSAELTVLGARTSATRNRGLFDHVVLFRRTLALMAALLAVVGGLGLLSAVGLNVLERRGELGVLRAVGAGGKTLVRVLLVEGLALGAVAVLIAALLSLPLSWWAGARTGATFVLVPLPFAWAPWAYATGLIGTLVLAATASWWPARALARRAVRRALHFA